MTDQQNVSDAVLDEALGVIDGALAKMMQRELVSSGEVADLLLDVRTLLTDVQPAGSAVEIDEIEPATPEPA